MCFLFHSCMMNLNCYFSKIPVIESKKNHTITDMKNLFLYIIKISKNNKKSSLYYG